MRLLAAAALATALLACAGHPDRQISSDPASYRTTRTVCGHVAGAQLWQRTELYFGLSKPDGSQIGDTEFQQFLDTQVTPRFAEGFTVLSGNGQFRGANGQIVRERSRVVVLFYAFDETKSSAIDQIRVAYKQQFQQESVLRVDTPACTGF